MNNNTLLNIGAAGNDLTSSGLACWTDGATVYARNATNGMVNSVGHFHGGNLSSNYYMTIGVPDSMMLLVINGQAGAGGLFMVEGYYSTTVTLVAGDSAFSTTAGSSNDGKIHVYKASGSNNTLYISNRFTSTKSIRILCFGNVSATAQVAH